MAAVLQEVHVFIGMDRVLYHGVTRLIVLLAGD